MIGMGEIMGERLVEIDYLRAIACISVIIVHITAGYLFLDTTGELTRLVFLFLNRALVYVVPAFLFISGLVLTYNYQHKTFNYFQFITKRTKNIIMPYFFWTVIFYVIFVQQRVYEFSLAFFLEKFFLGDLVYHLYFIVLIIQFYLLFGIFKWLFQKYNSFLLLVTMFVLNVLFMKYIYFPYVDRFFMQYLCFFALGCFFATNYQQLKKHMYSYRYISLVAYLVLSILLAQQFYANVILQKAGNPFRANLLWLLFSLVAILFYFSLALVLARSNLGKSKSFLLKVSDSSYYIYLGHPLMLMVAQKVITYPLVPSTTLNFLLTLVFVLGTVLPAAFLYQTQKRKWF
jgi:peptidoglycan/LPS O-acetylase OafA/YrhL